LETLKALSRTRNPLSWWISPTYYLARKPFLNCVHICRKLGLLAGEPHGSPPAYIDLKYGGRIEFRSADSPGLLVGDSLAYAVIDEAGKVKEDVWYESILPSLADLNGGAMIIGTPKGKNWFWNEYLKGQNPEQYPDYFSYTSPSYQNTFVFPKGENDPKFISLKTNMPEWQFQQEIMAQFLDTLTTVFEGVDEVIGGQFEPPRDGIRYFGGVDLGRKQDPSSVCIMTADGRLVWHRSLPLKMNWKTQTQIICDDLRRYRAIAFVDATGVGDPVFEEIYRRYRRVYPLVLTNLLIEDIMMALAMDISSQDIMIPADARELIAQLKNFQRDATGKVAHYSAPPGLHDDDVFSLAMANYARRAKRPLRTSVTYQEVREINLELN